MGIMEVDEFNEIAEGNLKGSIDLSVKNEIENAEVQVKRHTLGLTKKI